MMGLYKRVNSVEPDVEAAVPAQAPELPSETRINLTENRIHVRTYEVTGSPNHNLILNTICPAIQM